MSSVSKASSVKTDPSKTEDGTLSFHAHDFMAHAAPISGHWRCEHKIAGTPV